MTSGMGSNHNEPNDWFLTAFFAVMAVVLGFALVFGR